MYRCQESLEPNNMQQVNDLAVQMIFMTPYTIKQEANMLALKNLYL